MGVEEVSQGELSRRAVMDEVYIALLEILIEARQVVSGLPFEGSDVTIDAAHEIVQSAACELTANGANEDAGYPFSFCNGVYFSDILTQPIFYQSQVTTLGVALKAKTQAYDLNQSWLNVLSVDDVFCIRASSQASVCLLEDVQERTLAVVDALALYETLKKVCLSPGRLRIYLSSHERILQTAGIKFALVFSVTENDWVFEPLLTQSDSSDHPGELSGHWCFHAFVQTLYRLILGGGFLRMDAQAGQGSFSLSVETLTGVDYLGSSE